MILKELLALLEESETRYVIDYEDEILLCADKEAANLAVKCLKANDPDADIVARPMDEMSEGHQEIAKGLRAVTSKWLKSALAAAPGAEKEAYVGNLITDEFDMGNT